jgi:acetate kinase
VLGVSLLTVLSHRHNASAVAILQVCFKQLPKVQNIACFDSVFHHTLPDYVKTYAIDQKIAQRRGLRKYGFHGISYSYILRAVSNHLGKESPNTSIIALHLGSGASACAIKNGKSIDTSMGLTPVCGLPGATRSGDIDPSLIFHYTSEVAKLSASSTKDLHISEAEEILNKKSGWKALTGTTDFSKIAVENAPDSHKLAFNLFIDRIVGYIGNYFVKLDGQVDALVFAGGIGERSALLRSRVVEKCACLGFTIDAGKNSQPGEASVAEIGGEGRFRTLVCKTNEEVSRS